MSIERIEVARLTNSGCVDTRIAWNVVRALRKARRVVEAEYDGLSIVFYAHVPLPKSVLVAVSDQRGSAES